MKKHLVLFTQILLYYSFTIVETQTQLVQTNGLEGLHVYNFTVSGTNVFAGSNTSYDSCCGAAVFLTTDNGANWTNVSTGMAAPEVVASDPILRRETA
ncbi:MAG: hypothetical protein IIB41_02795 [Candidatus Marinimicrobia bacterium]|nr:hypothetical protein [Candidatus Neomarinimicrobiota bacterium]